MWQRKGLDLTKGYAKTVDPEFWTLTNEVLAAGVADVLKNFGNNVAANFSGFEDLEHAGVNSDEVDSGFGNDTSTTSASGSNAPRLPSLAWRTRRRVGLCWVGTRELGGSRLSVGRGLARST